MGSLIGHSRFHHPQAVSFNGVDEYLSRTGTLGWRSDTSGAWSMWVRIPATLTSDGAQFFNTFGVSSSDRTLGMSVRRISTTGTATYFSWIYRNNAGVIRGYSATTTAIAANTWYHIVFQSSGTTWTVRINGVSQTITQWTGTALNSGDWYGDITGTGAWHTIGVNNSSGVLGANFFPGMVNEILYFGGRTLTSGEVSEIYNSGIYFNPRRLSTAADIDSYFPLGDSRDSGTTVFDEVGANDFTLVNMDASNYVTA